VRGREGERGGETYSLVLAVVSGDGSVGGLTEGEESRGGNELRGHESEGSESLGNDVGLNISVVCRNLVSDGPTTMQGEGLTVLESHDESSRGLDHLSDHLHAHRPSQLPF
jgi:hypothetical protein